MLTEDFKPWLIEINSSPSMSYSTPVTTVLCEKVLEDSIKGTLIFFSEHVKYGNILHVVGCEKCLAILVFSTQIYRLHFI